jgi:hypothetical protein
MPMRLKRRAGLSLPTQLPLKNFFAVSKNPGPALPTADAPTFSPPAGSYPASQLITVTTTTPNPSISVRLNGGSWQPYNSPVLLGAGTTLLEAKTDAPGYVTSAIASATYVITTSTGGGGGGGGAVQFVSLPMTVNNLSPVLLKTGDTSPSRCVQLVDSRNTPAQLSTGAVVVYRLKPRGSTSAVVVGLATLLSPLLGICRYDFTAPLPAAGNYDEEWSVTDGGKTTTFPSRGFIPVQISEVVS